MAQIHKASFSSEKAVEIMAAGAIDGQSEWAARARRSLKFCEMQQQNWLTAALPGATQTCQLGKIASGYQAE